MLQLWERLPRWASSLLVSATLSALVGANALRRYLEDDDGFTMRELVGLIVGDIGIGLLLWWAIVYGVMAWMDRR